MKRWILIKLALDMKVYNIILYLDDVVSFLDEKCKFTLGSNLDPVWIGVFLDKNAQFDTKRNIHNRLEKLFKLNHVYKSHKSAVSKKIGRASCRERVFLSV